MSISGYKISDKNTNEALKEIEAIANEGKSGNFKIMNKQITINDINSMKEGVRYIDVKPDGVNRLIFKIGNKLKKIELSDID